MTSINEQLLELAQFKTLISNAMKDMGVVVPDTGFKVWYNAIRDALQMNNGLKPTAEVSIAKRAPVKLDVSLGIETGELIKPTVTIIVEKV